MQHEKRCANRMVLRRPSDSWRMERIVACVAVVVLEVSEVPTPIEVRTAREARREAMVEAKACRES